jgi:hypothetical protein
VVKETRPGCLVCPQNQGTFYGLAQRAPLFDYWFLDLFNG